MSLLVVDSKSGAWSLFDPVSLEAKRSGVGKVRAVSTSVSKAALIVHSLPKERGLAPASEVKTGLDADERATLRSLTRFHPLWLISDVAFFQSLPIEVTSTKDLKTFQGGLTHLSLVDEAARSLGKPASQLNLITLWLDRMSSVVAVRGGVPVEVTPTVGPQPDLVTWTEMKGTLTEILSKPKLRLNPRFQLGLKIYLHQLVLLVGAYAGLLGRLDGVVLSGALSEGDAVREELLKRLPFLLSVNVLVGSAYPLKLAAETLRRL